MSKEDFDRISETLARLPGFDALSDDELLGLAQRATIRHWKDGGFILRAGDPSESMHVLCEGVVRVPLSATAGESARTVVLKADAVIGEIGILSGSPRNADVISDGRSTTIQLRRIDIEPLLWEQPQLARFLTSLVRRRLADSGELRQVGKYRLLKSIGRGATSEVFEGVHEGLGRVVAVKMLSHSLAFDRPLRDRFLLEARTVATLDHPNIVRVYDTEAAFATYFIVMERLRGSDLREVLRARGQLPVEEALKVVRQLADALLYGHERGILHRDVKPANCVVEEGGQTKLMDFGIAARVDTSGRVGGGRSALGTPRYMAPEVARGRGAAAQSDLYSLAVLAFEAVTGRPPFPGNDPREVMKMHVTLRPPDLRALAPAPLPPGFQDWIIQTMAKDPADRPVGPDQVWKLLGRPVRPQPTELGGAAPRLSGLALQYPSAAEKQVAALLDEAARKAAELPGVKVLRGMFGEGSR